MADKSIIFVINCMRGGGAERVMTTIAQFASNKNINISIILTSQSLASAMLFETDNKVISYRSIVDECNQGKSGLLKKIQLLICKIARKICKALNIITPAFFVLCKYKIENESKVLCLRNYVKNVPGASVVVFLNNSILMTLLATKGLPNKVIISERSDTSQHENSAISTASISKLYKNAYCIVCQTNEASVYYANKVPNLKRIVIPNPLRDNLPMPFHGERRKVIVNFCRIDPQKNLVLLIEAFSIVHMKHPDYVLEIIGEPAKSIAPGYLESLEMQIENFNLEKSILIRGFMKNVHEYVKDCMMFVSSSDYEGLSNSMLEAMAIGMPVVSTDCLGGGAKMMIRDHENGLLVPRGDKNALAKGMCEIIENSALNQILSTNASRIREELTRDKVCLRWLDIIM